MRPFLLSRDTFHILVALAPTDKPLPTSLIKKIVKARVALDQAKKSR
jgi:DNA recombination-dependent growth factor C